MKIAAICDKDTAVGLKLAGIKEIFIANENPLKIWNLVIKRDDIGIVFITEEITELLGKHLKDYRLRENIPIVVEIPDKKGKKKEHVDFISHLTKKAVGVEIGKDK